MELQPAFFLLLLSGEMLKVTLEYVNAKPVSIAGLCSQLLKHS
jgi:hypothetical protein